MFEKLMAVLAPIVTTVLVVALGAAVLAVDYKIRETVSKIDVCAKPAAGTTLEQCHHAVNLARSSGD